MDWEVETKRMGMLYIINNPNESLSHYARVIGVAPNTIMEWQKEYGIYKGKSTK